MATASELSARLAALEKQRASGVASVTVNGHSVTYRSAEAIDRAIAQVRSELARAEGTRPVRAIRIYAEKDL